MLRYPTLAVTLLGIGIAIGISLLHQSEQPEAANPEFSLQPAPKQADPSSEIEQVTPAPAQAHVNTAPPTTTPLPEIDRDLLPLQRNRQATWLASANLHKQQIDKQARFAEHPNPGNRARPTLSAPTRRTIARVTTRPLSLKPAPKPERTS